MKENPTPWMWRSSAVRCPLVMKRFSLTKMLRADARTLEVPFIILSSKLKNTDFAPIKER